MRTFVRERREKVRKLVVQAVMRELVSDREFPARRERTGKLAKNRPIFMKTRAHSCSNFNALGDEFPSLSIREFLQASREGAGNDFR
jgi:hypothetical protein